MPPREVAAANAASEGNEHRSDDEDVDTKDPEASEGEEDEDTSDTNEGASNYATTSTLGLAPCNVPSSRRQDSPHRAVGHGIQVIPQKRSVGCDIVLEKIRKVKLKVCKSQTAIALPTLSEEAATSPVATREEARLVCSPKDTGTKLLPHHRDVVNRS